MALMRLPALPHGLEKALAHPDEVAAVVCFVALDELELVERAQWRLGVLPVPSGAHHHGERALGKVFRDLGHGLAVARGTTMASDVHRNAALAQRRAQLLGLILRLRGIE